MTYSKRPFAAAAVCGKLNGMDANANLNLTGEQLQAVKEGAALRLPVPQLAMECVVVRSDIYARVQSVVADDVPEYAVAALVEAGMREYDDHDPLLESYQTYRQE